MSFCCTDYKFDDKTLLQTGRKLNKMINLMLALFTNLIGRQKKIYALMF